MPNPPHELFNSPAAQVIEEMSQDRGLEGTGQDRSSSLSDIEDRADENMAQSEQTLTAFESDPNDTEAETERLEESPQKSRNNQDVVHTTANLLYSMDDSVSLPTISAVEEAGQASDVASLSDSTAEADQTVSISSSPRKRKRSDDDDDSYSHSRRSSREPGAARARLKPPPNARSISAPKAFQTEQWDNSRAASDGEQSGSEEEVQDTPGAVKVEKGAKQRTKKASGGEAGTRSPSGVSVSGVTELVAGAEARDSNLDEVEMEDPGEYASIENGTKDEENSLKKKSAMESLSAIEKCFASLRDKWVILVVRNQRPRSGSLTLYRLYDERLAKFNTELAMLDEPNATHPELLGMKEVLEQRRDEKIQYESTLLKYKLGSLQNKSKAEKAQVHGQYMQSVREIRDRNLEQANKEWYQIHKERRSHEDDVPEYMYQFPTRRSQQITHQTAYNKEVSLLAGVAKYRGFPAAPEIRGAKPSEIDSDLERMGIVQQAPAPLTRQPPTLRTSLTANAVLQRPKAVADEHFLEQNPWANPQHPAHLHRQTSALSRTTSPLATPALSKRPTEASLGPRSTFAVVEAHSGRTSSATVQQDRDSRATRPGYNARRDQANPPNTTRRHPPALTESLSLPLENQESRLQRRKASPLTTSEKSYPSAVEREQVQEMHMRPYIPKASLKRDNASFASTFKLPTMGSPTNRYPVIKAEDVARITRHSPTPQHYHRPVSVNGAAIGAGDRAVGS
ncbi:MAG: hypothetical protein Q9179_000616 [Wetmoreana sp. 5 TL-2023]